MSLIGVINDVAHRVVLLNRRQATPEEEAVLRELEANGWEVVDWFDAIRKPEPVR